MVPDGHNEWEAKFWDRFYRPDKKAMEGAFGNLFVAKEGAISLKKEITRVDGMHVYRNLSGPTPPSFTNSEMIARSLFGNEKDLLIVCLDTLNCDLFCETGSLERVMKWHESLALGE